MFTSILLVLAGCIPTILIYFGGMETSADNLIFALCVFVFSVAAAFIVDEVKFARRGGDY